MAFFWTFYMFGSLTHTFTTPTSPQPAFPRCLWTVNKKQAKRLPRKMKRADGRPRSRQRVGQGFWHCSRRKLFCPFVWTQWLVGPYLLEYLHSSCHSLLLPQGLHWSRRTYLSPGNSLIAHARYVTKAVQLLVWSGIVKRREVNRRFN